MTTRRITILGLPVAALVLSLVSCQPGWGRGQPADRDGDFRFAPPEVPGIPTSTPEDLDMNRRELEKLYDEASKLETIRGLLVLRNGRLVSEAYWNGSGPETAGHIQSVTKSVVGALVGIALEEGAITSLDQPMMDYFPELASRIGDPRKKQITVRHLLQMRAGFPWEESTPELFDILFRQGFRPTDIIRIPLIRAPGIDHDYSNFSSHVLGIIVSRATGRDLLDYAGEKLFDPLGIEPAGWTEHWDGYRGGHAGLELTARDMAKFGLLIENGGRWDGIPIVPEAWIRDSLSMYSEEAWDYRIGRHVKDMAYGYQWWTVQMGGQECRMAWGHGGQLIVLAEDLDLIVVVTADPFPRRSDGQTWRHEKANINLAADFIARGGATQ